MSEPQQPTELMVCVKCLRGLDKPEEGQRPGEILFDNLKTAEMPEGVKLTPVECLQNCDQGVSMVLRGGAKRWTYVYGNLHEVSHLDVILDGATRYHATTDGVIPWRERPEHFKRNCIARIPPDAT